MVGKRRLVVVVKMGDLRMLSHMWAGKKGSSPCPREFFSELVPAHSRQLQYG